MPQCSPFHHSFALYSFIHSFIHSSAHSLSTIGYSIDLFVIWDRSNERSSPNWSCPDQLLHQFEFNSNDLICFQLQVFDERVESSVTGYVRSRVHLTGVNQTTNVTCTATNKIHGADHSDAHMFTLIIPDAPDAGKGFRAIITSLKCC